MFSMLVCLYKAGFIRPNHSVELAINYVMSKLENWTTDIVADREKRREKSSVLANQFISGGGVAGLRGPIYPARKATRD
jgi:hypothetical protein